MGECAYDIISGLCCSHCGIYFADEHGYPVLCKDCFAAETKRERAGLQRATKPELGDDDDDDGPDVSCDDDATGDD